jgi:hypothetical protein
MMVNGSVMQAKATEARGGSSPPTVSEKEKSALNLYKQLQASCWGSASTIIKAAAWIGHARQSSLGARCSGRR